MSEFTKQAGAETEAIGSYVAQVALMSPEHRQDNLPGHEFSETNPTAAMVELCRSAFARFDEYWVVGHKGDHHRTLADLGVIDPDTDISVSHVHSTLGLRAQRTVKPPEESSSTYESILTTVNPDIEEHVANVVDTKRQVCVFMPFPNSGLSDIIRKQEAEENFVTTSPVEDPAVFLHIENKIGFARLVDKAVSENEATETLRHNVIPWDVLRPGTMYEDLEQRFKLEPGQAVYLQKALSGGGDGTRRIDSQERLTTLLQDSEWAHLAELGHIKVTAEVKDAYPANGSGCIVPTEDGDCVVLLDPPSHKPVGLEALRGKEGSGVGNDWTEQWPDDVLEQYAALATAVGKQLYREFGYTGMFGPDCLVQTREDGYRLYMNEINPRWQGTTPYQTYNALSADRVPLELVHYAVKLDDGSLLPDILKSIGDPEEYNTISLRQSGCFYMKIGGPKIRQTVKADLNGNYIYCEEGLIGPYDDVSGIEIATGRTAHPALSAHMTALRAEGKQPMMVSVKGPGVGETVGGELAPIGYIVGKGEQPVFTSQQPGVTPLGNNLFQTVTKTMLGN